MLLKKIYHYFLIKRSGLFDARYYMTANQDVQQLDMDPTWHFVQYGWREGKDPSENFDVAYYLESNVDVKSAGINPFVHYIRHGKKEGRRPNPGRHAGSEMSDVEPEYQDQYSQQTHKESRNFNEIVSIIIPTKNAGDAFESLMKMLKEQMGFPEVEIVVVDSGSQDETIQIAKKFKAKVIEIPPEDFSHSYARNLGAENASGDYLLFTVQDALPPNNTWLNTLMTSLKENHVSAVSCAEQPREDADLFYRVICWNHYEFLEVNNKDRILSMPAEPNYFSLRKNGQLSDLACLISAKLFNKYHYRHSYAEDLDLGLRLIADGHKLAFLGSTRIIHSHNRTANYFLKRGYVDNVSLSNIFTDFEVPATQFSSVSQDIAFVYHFICSHLFKRISEFTFPVDLPSFEYRMVQNIQASSIFIYPETLEFAKNHFINKDLSNFIDALLEISGYEKAGLMYDGGLTQSLLEFVHITFRYLRQSHDSIDKKLAEDFKNCLLKEAAILSGANLAFAYLNQNESERKKYSSIYSTLRENV